MALALLLSGAVVASAQVAEPPEGPEAPGAPADSLDPGIAGAPGDSLDPGGDGTDVPVEMNEEIQGFQNEGPGTRPRVAALEPEFHPTYKITYNRDQDVGTWGHDFDLDYPISRKLRFNSSASITIRENDLLNRVNRQEAWRAGLDYNLTGAVGMGVKFNRSQQVDTRNPGEANEVKTARDKETMDFSTSYTKTHFSGLSTALKVSAGLERNSYSNVESQGSTQDISATIGYEMLEGLDTSFGYTGRHSLLDSKQGDFESKDESSSHAINADFDYEWDVHSFSAGARKSFSTTEYPKEEQTEQRDQETESVDFGASFAPLENLGMDFAFDYSRNQSYYDIETTKDSDIRSRMLSGTIDYRMSSTTFSAQLRTEKDRNEHFSFQSGDTYHDSFGASITHTFGPRLDASFRGNVGLLSYHYDDPEANDQDRDLFDQEALLTVNYKPRGDISADIVLRVKENQLIYIRTTRSGDSKTTNTYSIQPSVRKSFSPRVTVRQSYELSADYTFYEYNRDSNFLIRNFGVTTELDWRMIDGVNTTFKHRYRGQDEGSYVEGDDGIERYGKNSERDDHTLSVIVRHKLFDLIDLEVKQDYSVQRRWVIEGDTRRLSWEKFDTSLSGKASVSHDLEDGTKIRISVTRTLRDATTITERQEDVWNASIMLERTF